MADQANILAVDDSPAVLELLTNILTLEGYQVRTATSGELALAAVAAAQPELILLDICMPRLDGLEVCRRLKASDATQHIPIILISGLTEVNEWVQGLKLGAVDYIAKPFQVEELLARVSAHLALGRANADLLRQAAHLRELNAQLQVEITERKRVEAGQEHLIDELRHALAQVKTLSGLIPICSGCKKIRDDQNYWHQVDSYIQQHSEAKFTFGLCPDCIKHYFPDQEPAPRPPRQEGS